MKIDMAGVGSRIKQAREKKGIRQEALAEAADISLNHLSHIENSKSLPSLKVLGKIMVYLEVRPDEIFCESVNTAGPFLMKETEQKLDYLELQDIKKARDLLDMLYTWKMKDNHITK